MTGPPGPSQKTGTPPWTILIVVLLTGMAGPINYYKVPPLMPHLMGAFHLTGGVAGFLMSIFAVVGVVLSIPAGLILRKVGYRRAGLMATGWLAAGAGLGAMASGPVSLLTTRFMEGIGLNLLAVVSPTIVALHFEGRKRAVAVGVWNAWYPLGSTVTFLIAPFLASLWGWRSVWWFGCLYALSVGVLYFFLVKTPAGVDAEHHGSPTNSELLFPTTRDTFRNREVWIMGIMFFCFAFMYIAYLTWTPTFLHKARGVALSKAAFTLSILSVIGVASSPCSGWLLARLRSPRMMCMAIVATFAALGSLTCVLDPRYVLPVMLVLGLIGGFIPSASLGVVARLIHERKVNPIAFSVVTVGQNMGILLGPTLLGMAMESSYGWPLAYAIFVPVGLIGMSAAAFIRKADPAG